MTTTASSNHVSDSQVQPQKTKKIALIVEGGGMRGIFSAGVLDSFYELGFDPFHLYIGVSAGSLNLISHLAGQYRRNYRVLMGCATSGQFINKWNFLRGGHYLNLDWLGNESLAEHPLDEHKAFQFLESTGKTFVVVSTSVETGKPQYHRPNRHNIHGILRGSCSVPILYRTPVYIDQAHVVDGSVGDPIPVKEAYKLGATDIIIIRSREKNYRKQKNNLEARLGALLYRGLPSIKNTIMNQPQIYNESLSFLEHPPHGINIYQIASESCLASGRTTTDTNALKLDYSKGMKLGKKFIEDYRESIINNHLQI